MAELLYGHVNFLHQNFYPLQFFFEASLLYESVAGDDKVSVVSLDERLSFDSDTNCTDKEISDFVSRS